MQEKIIRYVRVVTCVILFLNAVVDISRLNNSVRQGGSVSYLILKCLILIIFIYVSLSSSVSGDERAQEPVFSGLYSYHCPTNTWTRLKYAKSFEWNLESLN